MLFSIFLLVITANAFGYSEELLDGFNLVVKILDEPNLCLLDSRNAVTDIAFMGTIFNDNTKGQNSKRRVFFKQIGVNVKNIFKMNKI